MDASVIELIRFGYGPTGSGVTVPGGLDADRVIAQLAVPDPARQAFARPALADRLALLATAEAERKARRAGAPPDPAPGAALKALAAADKASWVPEAVAARNGFAERLVNLFANRLTVAAGRGQLAFLAQSFRDDVVRPHVTGRFADMLQASVRHPAMLIYLDQVRSVGPNSRMGKRRGSGLNENLARELLELHGMGQGYVQTDVTELARLLAGLTTGPQGSVFDEGRAEPGEKLILGLSFGAELSEIERFIEYLALRPETAESVARMLARHFLMDTPPPDLVAEMARIYLADNSNMVPLYAALLRHPAAADPGLHKVRSPHEFLVATLRALDLTGLETAPTGPLKRGLRAEAALAAMGQPVLAPRGPDGWPDTGADWISPPWIAARLDWVERICRLYADRADPVALVQQLLIRGPNAETAQAVAEAEQRWEGVAVLLGAPAFMRR